MKAGKDTGPGRAGVAGGQRRSNMKQHGQWQVVFFLTLSMQVLVAAGAALGQDSPKADRPPKAPAEEGRTARLGVIPRTVRDGALIVNVLPDSPAQKAGLEPGDVILSVDGYKVGVVAGLEYPLQSEVRRVKGVGAFKIRSRRTGKVVTKEIRLGGGPEGGDRKPPKDSEEPAPLPPA
jgi:predicted metalloprotease with PDZ domain